MIKDIVVNLSVGKGVHPAGDYAVSVASALEAHIAGIAFVYEVIVPMGRMGYSPAEVIDALQYDNEARGESSDRSFCQGDFACRRIGRAADAQRGLRRRRRSVRAHCATLRSRNRRAGQTRAECSRREDCRRRPIDSGRPVIFVPYVQKAPLKLDHIMVCWDGSRPATRAIADAMPLLERAGTVEVVIVINERGKQEDIEGADMGQHLARHGLNVEVQRITRGDLDVADALLSHAADADVDFIVMGGYGHSRLREFVLGGVTRSILRSMVVPVLMSH